MKAMLLAAGLGTRFQPHTLIKAKPALPFLNLPMAYYAVWLLNQCGVREFVFNTYHLPETVNKIFNFKGVSGLGHTSEIQTWLNQSLFQESPDGTQILGGAGGLKKAESFFRDSDNLVLMNSDEIILPRVLSSFHDFFKSHTNRNNTKLKTSDATAPSFPRLATLAVMDHPEVGHQFGGIWCDDSNRVIEIGKKPSRSGLKGWHFIGLQILNRKIFSMIPTNHESNIFYDVLNPILKDHNVYVHPVDCDWFETGNLNSYLQATQVCLNLIDQGKSNYLSEMLKSLRPQDTINKEEGHIIYGDPSFHQAMKKWQVKDFAVGSLPIFNSNLSAILNNQSKIPSPSQKFEIHQAVFAQQACLSDESYDQTLVL